MKIWNEVKSLFNRELWELGVEYAQGGWCGKDSTRNVSDNSKHLEQSDGNVL